MQRDDVPLCVDLDGTLLRSDLLIESALAGVRRNPLDALRLPGWLRRGRAHLKRRLAERAGLDVTRLPYDARVIAWLREEAGSRRTILCTAADGALAEAVAAHVGGFDEVLASDGVRNLSATAKAQLLSARFGERGFDYAADAEADLHVWRRARRAIVVNAPAGLPARVREVCEVERVFARERGGWRDALRALRPHQWLKNLLVLLPMLAAHLLFSPAAVSRALLAFACFCLCASAAYLVNDLLDLQADRQHPRKRGRPFAAGTLPIRWGMLASPLLAGAALLLALCLSREFAAVLFVYAATTIAYSLYLKRIAILDVVTLAALYTIRIIGGAVAIPVPASHWLLAFSMFLFLSLAMVKRYAEVRSVAAAGRVQVAGRGYATHDLRRIQALGIGSGCLSVLVLAFYIDSTASQALYRHQEYLWALTPALLYWIGRVWSVARRGGMHDDPLVFATTDRASLIVAGVCTLIVAAAI